MTTATTATASTTTNQRRVVRRGSNIDFAGGKYHHRRCKPSPFCRQLQPHCFRGEAVGLERTSFRRLNVKEGLKNNLMNVLIESRNGRIADDISEQFDEIVQAVREHGGQ